MKRWIVLIVMGILGCGSGGGNTLDASTTVDVQGTVDAQSDASPSSDTLNGDTTADSVSAETSNPSAVLLDESHLQLEGSFRLPAGEFGSPQWTGFTYGGTALAYNAEKNSLYLVGHDHHQMVAEIAIPEVVKSDQLAELKTATVLQNFVEITNGQLGTVDDGSVKVGGLLLHQSTLYGTVYSYYDADGSQTLSSFAHALSLADTASFSGFFQVGSFGAGLVSGYMTPVPAEWQSQLGGPALIGQCCIPIVSRTSYGPSAFVFDPGQLGQSAVTPAAALLYYPAEHPLGDWGATGLLFNGSTQMGGLVFPRGSRSVLFIGRQGTGEFCYGTGDDCNDPTDSSKGNHAYPYRTQVWAYDVETLLKVKGGQLQPWEVQPYKTWELTLPFATGSRVILGVAYDPGRQRVFVSQRNADGDLPIIQVIKLSLPTL